MECSSSCLLLPRREERWIGGRRRRRGGRGGGPKPTSPARLLNPPRLNLFSSILFFSLSLSLSIFPGGPAASWPPPSGTSCVPEGRETDLADSRPQSRMRRPKRIRHRGLTPHEPRDNSLQRSSRGGGRRRAFLLPLPSDFLRERWLSYARTKVDPVTWVRRKLAQRLGGDTSTHLLW